MSDTKSIIEKLEEIEQNIKAGNIEEAKIQAMELNKAMPQGTIFRTKKTGNTLLHLVAKMNNLELVHVVCLFHKELINQPNNNGNTPLHIASINNNSASAQALVVHGADQNAKNNDGLTPPGLASIYNSREAFEVINYTNKKIAEKLYKKLNILKEATNNISTGTPLSKAKEGRVKYKY